MKRIGVANVSDYMIHDFKGKPRKIEHRRIFGEQMLREFKRNRNLCRQRVVEAVFGGLANRHDTNTRFKRVTTKVISMLPMLVAPNLRTIMHIRAMKDMG